MKINKDKKKKQEKNKQVKETLQDLNINKGNNENTK